MFNSLFKRCFGILFTGALLILSGQSVAQDRPNIILIIGDDQGWSDFGFMPSSRTLSTNQGSMPLSQIVETPTLDSLAAGGVVFRNAHLTASICINSLRTLLSSAGLQPAQWNEKRAALDALPEISLPNNPPFFFPRPEAQHYRTIPRDLGSAGYKSWEGGKHWEGTYQQAGFTHGLSENNGSFLFPDGWDFGREHWDPALCGPDGDPYIPCPALDPLRIFLDEVQGTGDPFFVWFAPTLPHTPFDAPQNFRTPFENLGLTTCAEIDCGGNCENCANEVNYLSNISWLDGLIGELVNELEERNLRDDTLLIFLSDNGWGLNYQFAAGTGKGKGTLYELGHRTPIIFNWPGQVPAGVIYDDLISATEVSPTILDYAGLDKTPEQQGFSLKERLNGGTSVSRPEIVGRYNNVGYFLRTDSWRYIRFNAGSEELYQIDIDPFEDNDVSGANPALLTQFSAMVDAWELAQQTPPSVLEITGRLLDQITGLPLEGSMLKLENGDFPLVSTVGPDGWFRFGPVPHGSYSISKNFRSDNIEWLGTAEPVSVSVPVATAGAFLNLTGTQPSAVQVPVGTFIRGTLKDSFGDPIEGAEVVVSGLKGCAAVGSRVRTQADGSYRVENLPFATYTIKTTPSGFQQVVVEDVVIDAMGIVTEDLVAYP